MVQLVTVEHARLAEAEDPGNGWRNWGPYLAERAWGAPYARIIPLTANRGRTFHTTMRVRGPTVGMKTVWAAFVTVSRTCASA